MGWGLNHKQKGRRNATYHFQYSNLAVLRMKKHSHVELLHFDNLITFQILKKFAKLDNVLFAIDEVHTILSWGTKEFRPTFKDIDKSLSIFKVSLAF